MDDRHLLVGEKLFEEGKVTRLFENEPHLWIASVDGFEVEMQITPSRVKACSCECDQFEREKMCGHLAAGLLNLRRKLSEKISQPRLSQRPKQLAYQKLTVNAILDSVTQDELAAFVRNFARSNKQFSLALRAKFAAKVPLYDNREKFGQLLDSAISSYRKTNDRISVAGGRQLHKLLEELLGQADDALALEHFAEAWAMLSAIIGRFSPIIKKLEGDENPLHVPLEQAFTKINQLAALNIPPDLKEEISLFCSEEFNRPAYRLNGFSGQLLGIWTAMATDIEVCQQVLQAVDLELAKPKSDSNYKAALILAKLPLLARPGMDKANEAFTFECLSEPARLLQVVNAVEPSGDFRPIKALVEKGHRLIADADMKARLEEVLLQIAQLEGQKDVIATISRQKFLETRDFAFYEQCRAHHKGNWDNFLKKLMAELIGRYDFRQNINTIATILGRENKHDDLLRLLDEQHSLDLLLQFDHYLLKSKPKEIVKLYENLLKEFLTDHLGLKASQRLRSVFTHLSKRGANDMAERLYLSIKAAFPKRVFYLDEMENVQI